MGGGLHCQGSRGGGIVGITRREKSGMGGGGGGKVRITGSAKSVMGGGGGVGVKFHWGRRT
jgi:hypothetical protein